MKKIVQILLLSTVLILVACGTKLNQTGKEFKSKIIEDRNNLYGEDNEEKNFSFLIYQEKKSDKYLANVWVPYHNKNSELERFYSFDKNKDLIDLGNKNSFNDIKDNGNYEIIYKSGEFK